MPIASNIAAGSYPVTVRASYSGESTEDERTITVTCGSQTGTGSSGTGSGSGSGSASGGIPVSSTTDFTDLTSDVDEKSFFEKFNTGSYKIPTSVWVLIDLALISIIVAAIVLLFKK